MERDTMPYHNYDRSERYHALLEAFSFIFVLLHAI